MVTCTGTFNHSLISLINHWCIHSSNHISVYHCHSCMYASFPLILFVLHFLTYHAFILISWYLFQACEVLKGKLGHNQSLVVEYGADEMLPQELQDLLEEKYQKSFEEYYRDMRNNPKTWGMSTVYVCIHICMYVCMYV